MGRNTVWKAAGMEPMGGCLCVGCLEKRLGRRLRPKDFTRHPFNTMPGTKRLTERRTAGPAAMFDGTDMYVVFNGVRIAKRSPQAHTWVSLEPGYRVLDRWKPRADRRALISDIIVEYNGVRVQ